MVKNNNINRTFNVQKMAITAKNEALLSKHMNRNTGISNFPHKIPTLQVQNNDTLNISAEAVALLNTQQFAGNANVGEANVNRDAPTPPAREIPRDFLITEREFTVFSREVLAPHMEGADKHLALMRRAILVPDRVAGADLSLAERTIMRESMLLEAQRIADTYLSGEDAQRFVEGFRDLVHEAEMIERGYVRDGGFAHLPMLVMDGQTFRSPYSASDAHALNRFVEGNITASQRVTFDALTAEVSRFYELTQAIAAGTNNTITFQEAFDSLYEARAALQAFVDSMGEYHNFQSQWEAFNLGNAPADNWFVDAQANFELNSANIAEQIEEIRLNFHNEINLNGINGFRSIFEQLSLANADNTMMQWLMQLKIFNTAE